MWNNLNLQADSGFCSKKTLIEVAVSNHVRRTAQLKRNGLMATLQVTFY
jgi:hypothetical protein